MDSGLHGIYLWHREKGRILGEDRGLMQIQPLSGSASVCRKHKKTAEAASFSACLFYTIQ
jgi:hypothetical protein